MCDETSIFAIQTNLRNLLINFLNKTTIFFICFSLFESISISKLLLNEKRFSTLYVLCFLFLLMSFLIFCFFVHFLNLFKKLQFAILCELSQKKTIFRLFCFDVETTRTFIRIEESLLKYTTKLTTIVFLMIFIQQCRFNFDNDELCFFLQFLNEFIDV